MKTFFDRVFVIMGGFIWLVSSFMVNAETESPTDEDKLQASDQPMEEMVVTGNAIGELGLQEVSSTGSRLGLSAMQIPATVEIIDASVMRARGYSKLSDAVESLPGVVTGEHPTAPSTFSMRGFTRAQITVLRDGLWIGPSTMIMRPQNTFNLQRIEILRGPSSVINGQGAVAGTINAVSKTAQADSIESRDLLLAYGRYGSRHLGFASSGRLGESQWYHGSISQYATDGYVDRTDQMSTNLTGSLLWQNDERFAMKLSVDYLEDDVGAYFGTPLVPLSVAREPLDVISTTRGETMDGAMRSQNYNVEDAKAQSDQLFLRLDLNWRLSEAVQLSNTTYRFDADREWKNAEGYVYCTQVVDVCTQAGQIQRYYGYFLLDHDQELLGNRFVANVNSRLGSIENRFVTGFEVADLDFVRTRGFRRNVALAPDDAVDPYNPVPGVYGTEELRGASPTTIKMHALFAEDAIQITPAWSLVMALRYEEMELDRKNFNAEGALENNGFARDYDWWSWRIGTVYKITDDFVLYGQYSNAKDPINSNIFLVNANQNFDLTDAVQWELGFKAIFMDGRAETTLAYYDIERDDIFERFALDSATNIGGRLSNGFEYSLTVNATEHWRFGANAAYTDAEFKASANFQALAGNTPPNVPEWTANIWGSVRDIAELPFEAGISLHYIDDRFGNNQNSVLMKAYVLADLFAAWNFSHSRLSARIDNVLDEDYVQWSDEFYVHQDNPSFIYANELMLGAPRTYRITYEVNF